MAPTFQDGDLLLVHWFNEAKSDLPLLTPVLIERDAMPGVIFIKRIQKVHGNGYWVEGDNRDTSKEALVNDSRKWGYLSAHEIRGRVLFRLTRG